MFETITEANEHSPSKAQALEALRSVIVDMGECPGGQIVQRYWDAAVQAGAAPDEADAVVRATWDRKPPEDP